MAAAVTEEDTITEAARRGFKKIGVPNSWERDKQDLLYAMGLRKELPEYRRKKTPEELYQRAERELMASEKTFGPDHPITKGGRAARDHYRRALEESRKNDSGSKER